MVDIEKEVNDLRKLEREVAKVDSMNQDYTLKKHENDMVKSELDVLQEGDPVFK